MFDLYATMHTILECLNFDFDLFYFNLFFSFIKIVCLLNGDIQTKFYMGHMTNIRPQHRRMLPNIIATNGVSMPAPYQIDLEGCKSICTLILISLKVLLVFNSSEICSFNVGFKSVGLPGGLMKMLPLESIWCTSLGNQNGSCKVASFLSSW